MDLLIVEIQGNGWDLSMTRISYKLSIRTTKTKKFEKSLKMYNIINFKTPCYILTSWANIVHLIGNYKFMRPVSIWRLPKEWKKKQKQKTQRNYARKVSQPFENDLFSENYSVFKWFFKSNGIVFQVLKRLGKKQI